MFRTLSLSASLLLALGAAHAADAVTDAIQAAYAPYREALFRTNTKSQPESAQALAQVSQVHQRAAAEVDAARLADAHETLEQVRDLLAELRSRNGVFVFSDAMNAYHAEMEHLIDAGAREFAAPQGALQTMARVGALEVPARQLRARAPAPLDTDGEFAKLLQAVEESVAALRRAVLAGDATAVGDAIGELEPAYSRLFVKFG